MHKEELLINNIPSIIWGDESEQVYLFVHGKMSSKESAADFAEIATSKGYQVISFDLPAHGERYDLNYPCDIINGIHDLNIISEYALNHWKQHSLFACSLGAYFSLHAYKEIPFQKCLFLSPIVNMIYLVHNMFQWFNVSEKQLEKEKKIPTPIDTLSWDYYQYIKKHPIDKWISPTYILYGALDELQSPGCMKEFSLEFNVKLKVAEGCDHPFGGENASKIVIQWMQEYI